MNEKVRKVEIVQNSVAASDLLGQLTELKILHNMQEYKLKLTSNDKLILTK